ncbi:hypothetical protein HYU40_04485 [Candidatus Woesearchaeota archaeon]|nr:hypothetical protein [Candidatus Woesearchaeota archaeon]
MRKKAIAQIALETLPLLFGAVIAYFLWSHTVLFSVILLAMIGLLFSIKRLHGDIFAFGYGMLMGFVIEVFETDIAHIHTFAAADLFGMPLWMPIIWGYGFVLMKRIGIIIYEDAKPHK